MMNRLLTMATRPPNNPASAQELARLSRYEITLIDHDYEGRTPVMWNAAHRRFGIDGMMAMMIGNPADAQAILQSFRNDPKYVGGGVGAGFKEAVIPHLDALTPLAKAIGAVNIIRKEPDGSLVGHNTDGIGYARSLAQKFAEQRRTIKGANVLILGARGTARAIALVLAQEGARLIILNRTPDTAEALAQMVNDFIGADAAIGGDRLLIPEALPLQDAVISIIDDAHSPLDAYSTLGGMALPVTPDSIQKNLEQSTTLLLHAKPELIVSDIRLRKEETPMLRQAHELGFDILNGLPMVVNQGVAAFWWLHQSELEPQGIELADIEDVMWSTTHM
jgi:shikimate dehydrogenase